MKYTAFQARSPFEIGDKIKTQRRTTPGEAETFGLDPAQIVEEVHTITDIVCMNYVRSGKTEFLYELDDSGKLVRVEMPPAPDMQEPRPAGRSETQNQTDTESGALPPQFVGFIKRRFS